MNHKNYTVNYEVRLRRVDSNCGYGIMFACECGEFYEVLGPYKEEFVGYSESIVVKRGLFICPVCGAYTFAKVIACRESRSKWYNPLTWGKYEFIVKEEF